MDTAIVFPGMGPPDVPLMSRFLLVDPVGRQTLAEASDALGYHLLDRCVERETDYADEFQVLFLVTCLALARTCDARPLCCAGPSFGGKAAAVYSGALAFADAVRLTAELARLETRYFTEDQPGIVTQSFMRTPREQLDLVLAELDELGEWYEISCFIDDDFAMLSLREQRLEWLKTRLRAFGGFPLYTMDPPMHASAFRPLRDRVAAELFTGLTFTDPHLPVVADQDGSVRTTADGVRAMLLDGYVRPVRWPSVVDTLTSLGVTDVIVSGPDSLFGRVPRTTTNFAVTTIDPRTALRPVLPPVLA
jgi:[acyl-carrier-protein] S-malonyltransferase